MRPQRGRDLRVKNLCSYAARTTSPGLCTEHRLIGSGIEAKCLLVRKTEASLPAVVTTPPSPEPPSTRPVHQLHILLFQLALQVPTGQAIILQLCHLLF